MSSYCKYYKQKKQVSYDNGVTWIDVVPAVYQKGSLIESNSTDCGYIGTIERWVNSGTTCSGYDKYNRQVKQISTDGVNWTTTSETQLGSLIEANSTDCGYVPPSYSGDYLTFVALENGSFSFRATSGNTIYYSLDNGSTWTSLASGASTPTITTGNKVLWKGTMWQTSPKIGTFSSTGRYNVEGNAMSLLYGDNFNGQTSLSGTCGAFYMLFKDNINLISAENLILPATTLDELSYGFMFEGCTSLTTAPELPATTLANFCYEFMFDGCTSLTTAPALPAATMRLQCYGRMFEGCTSLTTAPELPATTLAQGCYQAMFDGCTNLSTAPALPATVMKKECYQYMFQGCTSLRTSPELPATALADSCYQQMFWECSSLTTAPALPATTLADSCYAGMFNHCSSLRTAPALPATTLTNSCYQQMFAGTNITSAPALSATTMADYCYRWMFSNCTNLRTAPALPATTLAKGCYYSMFYNNTKIINAPVLSATTLADECYRSMFFGCSSLNYIKMLATDISATDCLHFWVYNVASTGRFVKASSMESLPSGINGIPNNWTVQNA